MSKKDWGVFRDIVIDSCRSLFECYGVGLFTPGTSGAQTVGDLDCCGMIGFTSTHLRGTLVVAATSGPLKSSKQVEASNRAWMSELTNQLLGRVRNRLLAHGVDLRCSTPVALAGRHLQIGNHEDLAPAVFAGDDGHVLVWVDLELGPEWPDHPAITPPAAEGELLLF